MSIKSCEKIDNQLISEICDAFETNYNFIDLKEKYSNLDYNILYSILYSTGKYRKEVYNYLYQYNINESKILLISDTHYGSVYENMNYTYDAIDFAVANGIHIVLHGGDIIEAGVKQKSGFNIVKQANHFIDSYPLDKSINTYALFGNHDYMAINQDKSIMEILSSRKDINILGFKKAYLKWCGNIIGLQHDIENIKLNLPYNAEYICFKGHSHFYHVIEKKNGKNERIFIPSMCDNPINYKSKPGFLVAEIGDSNIVVINYSFNNGKIEKENEFRKSLKKRLI